jgi:hypothetical protein
MATKEEFEKMWANSGSLPGTKLIFLVSPRNYIEADDYSAMGTSVILYLLERVIAKLDYSLILEIR